MDVKQLEEGLREGRIEPGRLIDLLEAQQKVLAETESRNRELESRYRELESHYHELKSRNSELEESVQELRKKLQEAFPDRLKESYSVKAEEQRQKARGRKPKKKKRKKPSRRGRIRNADKLRMAQRQEDVYPEGVDRDKCWLSHSRPIWRLIDGRAVLVAYHVYRGPNDTYGKIPGTLGRSEYGLEITITIAFLVYVMGLSLDKVCALLKFFQDLDVRKSQVDSLLNQLGRHWEQEFETLCTLLAHSAMVHADETSWSIRSVWAFLSEKASVILFGVNKSAETLKEILDAATFAGILISDDAAVYARFNNCQKCWAHLLRKAIKLTLLFPKNKDYRELADEMLDIYREAVRIQNDGRMKTAGRMEKVKALEDRVLGICGPAWFAELPRQDGPEDGYRLLCNEMMRLLLEGQLFTFVTAEPVETPRGDMISVPGTNNASEQELRTPAQCRVTGRTNKKERGARRQTIVFSVLESLRKYLDCFTLREVLKEVERWDICGRSCFAELLEKLNLQRSKKSILDTLLPLPSD